MRYLITDNSRATIPPVDHRPPLPTPCIYSTFCPITIGPTSTTSTFHLTTTGCCTISTCVTPTTSSTGIIRRCPSYRRL